MNTYDPASHTPPNAQVWNSPEVVSSFLKASASRTLLDFVREFAGGRGPNRDRNRLNVLDIGCGAGRNTLPLAEDGHYVVGVDIAPAMVEAATESARTRKVYDRCSFLTGRMDRLPLYGGKALFDIVVSHGVWNLAETEDTFRAALLEASRLARPGAALIVTTFSRNTLPPNVEPVPGTRYIYTQFNNAPQCFLREEELLEELEHAGFTPWPGRAIQELNRPAAWERTVERGPRAIPLASPKRPVLYEGIWYRS